MELKVLRKCLWPAMQQNIEAENVAILGVLLQ